MEAANQVVEPMTVASSAVGEPAESLAVMVGAVYLAAEEVVVLEVVVRDVEKVCINYT